MAQWPSEWRNFWEDPTGVPPGRFTNSSFLNEQVSLRSPGFNFWFLQPEFRVQGKIKACADTVMCREQPPVMPAASGQGKKKTRRPALSSLALDAVFLPFSHSANLQSRLQQRHYWGQGPRGPHGRGFGRLWRRVTASFYIECARAKRQHVWCTMMTHSWHVCFFLFVFLVKDPLKMWNSKCIQNEWRWFIIIIILKKKMETKKSMWDLSWVIAIYFMCNEQQ